MSERRARRVICGRCDTECWHHGRGLCVTCYRWATANGCREDYERPTRPREEMLDEWDWLRRQGYTIAQAAPRIGVTVAALDKAIERAGREGDPRAARKVAA